MRKVVFHYHLFKNAGTSIDEVLKLNFTGRWVTREFNGNGGGHAAQVARWLVEEKDAVAFSSHTAMLPPPKIKGVEVFPVLFIRHPLDRIASAYAFESRQGNDGFGAVLARNTTLAGYVEVRLSIPQDRQCRNFQVTRLAQMFRPETGDGLERAMQALDALPFVGLVEAFDESIERLVTWLAPHFDGFKAIKVARNMTRDHTQSLEQKLAQLRAGIGETLWSRLEEANREDLVLFDAVASRYAYKPGT
jgi:hypothetical protein